LNTFNAEKIGSQSCYKVYNFVVFPQNHISLGSYM